MALNAAMMYQNNSIQTATPAELTLMLYDGAIKFCNIALLALDDNNIEKVNINLIKAQKIISELRVSLDKKYSVWKDFDNVYAYIYDCLIQANIHKDKEKLSEGLGYIREMRETWKEVMRLNKVQ
ncbi:flagellar export chaperone FliS [Velocimicrobium porci]|uniref:Flagellar export chaperone FliS n=1 Tax=Velocimicrobium porci TaxID=2606634 RepID=A0A6L5XZ28_9FIRM|nr:flagellar export chaperone FliS [Velocimicrobium porci]MSS63869.1 flagellar export chaperone FliS [Velocimicrobium porci]